MKIFICILLIFSFSVFSQTASKEQIKTVLKFMEAQGLFKKSDLEQAKKDMESMSDSDWNELNNVATKITVQNAGVAKMKENISQGKMQMPTKKRLKELKEEMKIYKESSDKIKSSAPDLKK
jgi:hypothetical protein